jgi:hypothetical protein
MDSTGKIIQKFDTTFEYITRGNNFIIISHKGYVDDRILLINQQSNRLDLFNLGRFITTPIRFIRAFFSTLRISDLVSDYPK